MAQGHTFVFTLNNYDDDDISRLQSLPPGYLVLYGKETAPSTGTPHLQGVLWRLDGTRFRRSTARNLIGKHAWVDKSADVSSARGYCLKDGNWWTNMVSTPELYRLMPILCLACSISPDPSWLGSVLDNAIDRPEYTPCRAYYNSHKFNRSLPAHN